MAQNPCTDDDFGVFLDKWNKSQNYRTPIIHYHLATWLQRSWERGENRLLLQAFRASGKSTIVGLFAVWLLCRDPDLRILVLSAEARLAQKMVRTIRKIIEKHPSTKSLIPNNPDEWASDSFTVKRSRVSRDPSVLASGLYANTTGARADVILCDDVEVPNTCDTADKREKLRERLIENEFILVPGGMQLYIGTPHTYFTIYADTPRTEIGEIEPFLKGYKSKMLPALNARGESAWPERYSIDEIESMRLRSGPAKFSSQMMLMPVNLVDGRLNPALLQIYCDDIQYHEVQQEAVLKIGDRKMMSASAWWDPSFGKSGSDASVLAVVYTDAHGNFYLHHVEYIHVEAKEGEDEASLQCRIVGRIARDLYLPSITVETNGIGRFLPNILRRELGDMKIPATVQERTSTKGKAERILSAFDAPMAARALYVHDSVYNTPFIREMQEWRPSASGCRDDGLDAAAGAIGLEPVRIRRIHHTGGRLWNAGGLSHRAVTEFQV